VLIFVEQMIYVIGIVEMCERFAYYGTTAVCAYIYNAFLHIWFCTDTGQSSTLSSSPYLTQALSQPLEPQAQMVRPVLWVWDNRHQQDWYNSTSSSLMLCPWLVGETIYH